MADFSIAIKIVLANEGGATPSLDNNGQPVRYGINRAANPSLDPSFYSGAMPADQALALAESVYRANYWGVIDGDQIVSQALANQLMDHAVNAGTGGAALLLQAILNEGGAGLVLDGGIGPATIAAANAAGDALATAFSLGRVGYYIALSLNGGNSVWRGTWLARVKACAA